MPLATTCPRCGTTFRIVPDQLKLRGGLVRCGRCRQVFSGEVGLRRLDDGPAAAAPPPAAPEPLAAPSSVDATPSVVAAAPEPAPPRTQAPAGETATSPDEAAPAAPPPRFEPDFVLPPPDPSPPAPGIPILAATPAPEPRVAGSREPPDTSEPSAPLPVHRASAGARAAVWALACALSVLLALQLAVGARDLIAARHPEAIPALQWLATRAGVELAPPASLEPLTIQSFELEATAQPDRFAVHGLLRNGAQHPVRWPWLDLSLTDANGGLIARRAIGPDEYLAGTPGATVAGGVPPRGETGIRLSLEIAPPPPAGYSVILFHP